ncbi:MAG: hypothetical protein EU544_04790 [Promethearchaeota archaeon]|nr:MAG: hypothetical protein EU544_04790 [Candidatus Lokiarchaeota archaeon]
MELAEAQGSILDAWADHVNLINISTPESTLFEWKPPQSFKNYQLDLNHIRKNEISEVFFRIDRGTQKLVYIRKKDLIFTIAAQTAIQNQLLEAFLEYTIKRFNEMYDVGMILSFSHANPQLFSSFEEPLEEMFKNFKDQKLVKRVKVPCGVCHKNFDLIIKTKLIEESPSSPVPVVCLHEGHALLCYIDKQFKARASGKVNFAG